MTRMVLEIRKQASQWSDCIFLLSPMTFTRSNKHIRRLKANWPPYKPWTFFMRSMVKAWDSPIQSTSCLKSNNQLLWRVTHHFLQIFQVWWKVATGQAHLVPGPKHPVSIGIYRVPCAHLMPKKTCQKVLLEYWILSSTCTCGCKQRVDSTNSKRVLWAVWSW